MDKLNLTTEDFQEWLKRNRATLQTRTSDEVASMAYLCGFEWEVICPTLVHFYDAIQGSSFDRRSDFQIKMEILAIEKQSGKSPLIEQWCHLFEYLETGKEFEKSQ